MNNRITTLQSLYNDILKAYELSSDSSDNRFELSDIRYLVEKYDGTDWKLYVKYLDDDYNKILMYKNNDFDVYIICWKKGQSTRIHDHPVSGCLMKVLHGSLEENLYRNNNYLGKINNLKFICKNILNINDVGYQINNNIIHGIIAHEDSVSLHIYSPSNYQSKNYNY